jgi:hypothetical protein
MLHAVIRSGQGAVHVIGDVSDYNLETLLEHARYSLAHGETVSMKVEVDVGEHDLFLARSQRWMRRLTRSGVQVDVEVAPAGQSQQALAAATPRESRRLRAVGF